MSVQHNQPPTDPVRTGHRSPLGITIFRFAAHCFAGFCVAAVLLVVLPAAIRAFTGWGIKLPEITLRLRSLSAFFSDYWYALIPAVGIADFVLLYLLELKQPSGWAVRFWFVAVLLIALALLLWATLAVTLPIPRHEFTVS